MRDDLGPPRAGGGPVNVIDVAFVLLALILGTALVARRFSTPAPILFAVVGIGAGLSWHLFPGLPPVAMPPALVLFVFLPPLLVTAAYALPLGSVRRNLRSILSLAVGLVLATMLVGAAVGHWAAGLPWAAAFVLGASRSQSRTMMRSLAKRSDRADLSARRIIFFGVRWA